MNRVLRYLDSGAHSGSNNMALDETLLSAVRDGSDPILRLYGWDPPAVSLGYAQNAETELDVKACRAAGVDVVRRPTGGRAVLHWQELTYSVICSADSGLFGSRIEDVYGTIGACLVSGLRRFGIEADLEEAQLRAPRPRQGRAALPCFSSIARSEVKWNDRKLVGSAQRRFPGAVLQHGSIVIGPAHEQLVNWLRIGEDQRVQWRDRLRADSACLEECLGEPVDRTGLIDSIAAGFSDVLNCELAHDEVRSDEWQRSLERANFWTVESRSAEAAG